MPARWPDGATRGTSLMTDRPDPCQGWDPAVPYRFAAPLATVEALLAGLRPTALVTGLRADAVVLATGFALAAVVFDVTAMDFLAAGFAVAGALLAFTVAVFLTAGFAFAATVLVVVDVAFLTAGFAFAVTRLVVVDATFLAAGFAFAVTLLVVADAAFLTAGFAFGATLLDFAVVDFVVARVVFAAVVRADDFGAGTSPPPGVEWPLAALVRHNEWRPSPSTQSSLAFRARLDGRSRPATSW